MCNCSSSFFSHSLLVLNARLVKPNSVNCRWRLKRIQHSILNCSWRSHVSPIHKIDTLSSSKSGAQCYFDSKNSAFLGQSSKRIVFCLSSSSLPNEEDVVHQTVDIDSAELPGESDLIQVDGDNDLNITGSRGFKQTTTRSNLVAKQVISIQSALSLGFISQLWVDTSSWLVLVVDVKPSLLSGESERFLLKDIVRVGDVVLVNDETVLDTEFKMVGLETLVGYRVVTPGRRNIGKVRGYSFNINSGIVESLELDSFGVTIIPSSLVSTYRLDVEDIIEVLQDIVVVHEDAASRKQRLTKGLWDGQFDSEYSDVEELESSSDRRRRRRNNRSNRKKRDLDDDEWDIFR
ncbi:PRC-barrel-like superfamily [Arabidopsis thaliana x Arabidopsis arenosa]|uniref:PRC-barrel-like superfamily n=1 Tax=Arabidopsis thaliana x Arabidopsis arenosa TaxID=1240361 RepID=A0A8T2A7T8_9BRAS|nr:PRC-barrel-like superfamily [Arabidopsis thaliana x Arabidopsis arenosa]